MATENLLDTVYNNYLQIDYTPTDDNLNPIREITESSIDKNDQIRKLYGIIKDNFEQIVSHYEPEVLEDAKKSIDTGDWGLVEKTLAEEMALDRMGGDFTFSDDFKLPIEDDITKTMAALIIIEKGLNNKNKNKKKDNIPTPPKKGPLEIKAGDDTLTDDNGDIYINGTPPPGPGPYKIGDYIYDPSGPTIRKDGDDTGYDPTDPNTNLPDIEIKVPNPIPPENNYETGEYEPPDPDPFSDGDNGDDGDDENGGDGNGDGELNDGDDSWLDCPECTPDNGEDEEEEDDSFVSGATPASIGVFGNTGNVNPTSNPDNSNKPEIKKTPTEYADCAKYDLQLLKIILITVKLIKSLILLIDPAYNIITQVIEILALAFGCWRNPPNVTEICQRLLEMTISISCSIVTKMIEKFWKMLGLNCITETSADLIKQIQDALRGLNNVSRAVSETSCKFITAGSNVVKDSKKIADSFNSAYKDFTAERETKWENVFGNKDYWKDLGTQTVGLLNTNPISQLYFDIKSTGIFNGTFLKNMKEKYLDANFKTFADLKEGEKFWQKAGKNIQDEYAKMLKNSHFSQNINEVAAAYGTMGGNFTDLFNGIVKERNGYLRNAIGLNASSPAASSEQQPEKTAPNEE